MRNTLFVGGLAALTLVAAGGVAVAQQAAERAGRHGPAHADADGDGRVSQTEFVGQRVAPLARADADHDGAVTPQERHAAMQARRTEQAGARFERIDTDHDGALSRAEFDAGAARRMAHRGQGGGRMHPRGPGADGMAPRGPAGAAEARPARGPVVIADVQARTAQAFTRIDADHDGFISTDERQSARQVVRARMTERRAAHRAERQASPSAPASE